ncbi:MAG: DNA-binding protein [Rickettsiales bacterium]|nr:DNA-binding protein [Rickettsiales bacterium]|tara:strand:- start:302 stop:847 length:546 start_codon:yes stop_codon:yes gene_type:complete
MEQTQSKDTQTAYEDHPDKGMVIDKLEELGIQYKIFEHEPVFTVEQGLHLHDIIPGGHCKNLFLKDKKGELWLISAIESTKIDLKKIEPLIASARLSFASPERLEENLKVKPGSVTPFALIHDEYNKINVILDSNLFDYEQVNFHPLHNHESLMLTPNDLVLYIKAVGYQPKIVDLSGKSY